MEANGFKKRLEEAKDNSNKVKIIFQYPASDRAIIKSGIVTKIFEDSFELEEKFDGLVTYSYKYIVEVMEVKE